MNNISERLKQYRTMKSYSVREVASKLGVSPSTYRSWENGVSISGEPYLNLAKIFDISLTELLTGEKNEAVKTLEIIEEYIKQLKKMC